MLEVPSGSIYFWMYTQGLKQVNENDIASACRAAGVSIRDKDWQNYWNGYYNSDMYHGRGSDDMFMLSRNGMHAGRERPVDFLCTEYRNYPEHPYAHNEYQVENRWVPCNKDNKPMIKWGNGCLSLADACAYKSQVYLAENLKGTRFIVIDCDGDHGDELDLETMAFLNWWRDKTHCIVKPGQDENMPASFHLTFETDRIIPTMHFPYAHIDIVGNRRNSLRYWKNKKWNGIAPATMTDIWWQMLQEYIEHRKETVNV